jgi:hypothetical protein
VGDRAGVWPALPLWRLVPLDRRAVWIILGFPTYGGGPFEDVGIQTTVTLLGSFLLVCVAEVVAGFLLWGKKRTGGLLALPLLPLDDRRATETGTR